MKHVRTVRDLCASLGKRARLELVGEDTELDKLLVEAVDEPLMHLVRNSVDHGLEPPDVREAAGKPRIGTISLQAAQRGNSVVVSGNGVAALAAQRGMSASAPATARWSL